MTEVYYGEDSMFGDFNRLSFLQSAWASDPLVTRAQLESKWNAQRNEIVTGRFSVKLYRIFDPKASAMSAEVVEQLADPSFPMDAARLARFYADCQAKGLQQSTLWNVPFTVTVEGNKIRNDSPDDVFSYDGNLTVRYNVFNKQADVEEGLTPIKQIGLQQLRFVPDPLVFSALDLSRMKQDAAGRLTCDAPMGVLGVDLSLDRDLALVRRFAMKGDGGGKLKGSIHQIGSAIYDGVVLPKFTLECDYKNGNMSMLSVHEITSAEINRQLAPDAFRVSIPKSVVLVDRRKDKAKPTVWRTDDAAPDAVAEANEPASSPSSTIKPESWTTYRWVLAVSVVLFLVVMIYRIWTRR